MTDRGSDVHKVCHVDGTKYSDWPFSEIDFALPSKLPGMILYVITKGLAPTLSGIVSESAICGCTVHTLVCP